MRRIVLLLPLCAAFASGALTPIDETAFEKLVQSHKGKVVLYNFWATWCAPCRAQHPLYEEVKKK